MQHRKAEREIKEQKGVDHLDYAWDCRSAKFVFLYLTSCRKMSEWSR